MVISFLLVVFVLKLILEDSSKSHGLDAGTCRWELYFTSDSIVGAGFMYTERGQVSFFLQPSWALLLIHSIRSSNSNNFEIIIIFFFFEMQTFVKLLQSSIFPSCISLEKCFALFCLRMSI